MAQVTQFRPYQSAVIAASRVGVARQDAVRAVASARLRGEPLGWVADRYRRIYRERWERGGTPGGAA